MSEKTDRAEDPEEELIQMIVKAVDSESTYGVRGRAAVAAGAAVKALREAQQIRRDTIWNEHNRI